MCYTQGGAGKAGGKEARMFLTIDTWRALLGRGALDAALARLYGAQAPSNAA